MDGSRRSQIVLLTLLGLTGVGIAAPFIPQGTRMQRNLYASREACLSDYSAAQCEPSGTSTGGSSGGWHGPYYSASGARTAASDPGPGRSGARPVSVETSTRGGFGAIGRAFGRVG